MSNNFKTESTNSADINDFKNELPPMNDPSLDHHLEPEEIKSLVYQLLTETDCERDDKLRKCKNFADLRGKYQHKYKDLMLRYPALYTMVLETGREFDLIQFEQMMGMIAKVRRKEVDEHTASKEFGEKMVDKYVKPNL